MSVQTQMLDPTYINPELDRLLKTTPNVRSLGAHTDIVALRAQLRNAKKALTQAHSAGVNSVQEEDVRIPMRDGASITVRIYKRKHPQDGGSPIFVMYHGGGFCLGGIDNEALLCRKWAEELGGVTVNVDYRLAPEHPFPIPVYDAFDSLKWVAENFESIGGNPQKGFVIGGISAGGNLSAVISHLYRDEKLSPPLTGVYLSIPSIFAPSVVPEKYKDQYLSREQNKNAPILDEEATNLFTKLYEADPSSPLRSPGLFKTGHANLPPTYFQICGMDPLRDEGLIYERMLREENNVVTRVDLYPGLPHGFWSFYPGADFTKKQQEDSVNGMAWLLGHS